MEHLPGYEDIGILLEGMGATIERVTPQAPDLGVKIHAALEGSVSSDKLPAPSEKQLLEIFSI